MASRVARRALLRTVASASIGLLIARGLCSRASIQSLARLAGRRGTSSGLVERAAATTRERPLMSLSPSCREVSRDKGAKGARWACHCARGTIVGAVSPVASGCECSYTNLPMEETPPGISVHDITPQVRACVAAHFANRRSFQRNGVVHLLSRHTTTAVTINEDEARLREDIIAFLQRLVPSNASYKHNDLHLRPASDKDRGAIERNWMSKGKGTLEEFMAQEPRNAHSHLLAMLVGQSETIPVVGGELALGQWQSILFLDLDGPRDRFVGVQVLG